MYYQVVTCKTISATYAKFQPTFVHADQTLDSIFAFSFFIGNTYHQIIWYLLPQINKMHRLFQPHSISKTTCNPSYILTMSITNSEGVLDGIQEAYIVCIYSA